MQRTTVLALSILVVLVAARDARSDGDDNRFNNGVTFSTLITTDRQIEGLTGDGAGNLYAPSRPAVPGESCVVWRINAANPSLVIVGRIDPCVNPVGLAFNAAGDLFVADGSNILWLRPNAVAPPTATVFATGVPGTNGLGFDRDGNLWTGDGVTALGRVWRISPAGEVAEMFRVQPMRNALNVGRRNVPAPPDVPPGQNVVANGLAFTEEGDLLVADTARGAIWRVSFDSNGAVKNRTGCDATFPPNTLCLDSITVAHPLLEGIDGIALDEAGNVFADANERNAIVVVPKRAVSGKGGNLVELFRNPASAATGRRNEGPLEFPSSPFLLGRRLCTSNFDLDRRDNSPRAGGEIDGGAGPRRGSISCMDQRLNVRGLPLPIQ